MEKILPIARQLGRARWLPPVVILLTLAILGGLIALATGQLREAIGRQIIHRDAEVLAEVASLEQIGAGSPDALERQLHDTAGQLALALRLSRLRQGVLATRLFDHQGRFVAAMPVLVKETQLTAEQTASLAQLRPVSRYQPAARLADHFLVVPQPGGEAAASAPLLSVLIPLHAPGQTNLLAVAELIQDGRGVARALADLDRHLTRQAALAFFGGGGIVALALGWAFRRIYRITRQLEAHAADLRRANQELALAAKTSALGAVTAHLLHGLTSPLTGLRNFMVARAAEDADWQDALRGTERMQAIVGEAVRLLSEHTNGTDYELSFAELGQIVCDRLRPAAEAAGVTLECQPAAPGALDNHQSNLVLLILENLLQNALQATPRNKTVRLTIAPQGPEVVCEVADEGPGLPASVRDNLFLPCRSTKPGGNGLGLALSHHLARHLGAELKLVRSSEAGTAFELVLSSAVLRRRPTKAGNPESTL